MDAYHGIMVNDNIIYDFKKTCRLCTSTDRNMKDIFEEHTLKDFLISSFALQITENDSLPSVICDECIFLTRQASEFKYQCLNSHDKLHKILQVKLKHFVKTDNTENRSDIFELPEIRNYNETSDTTKITIEQLAINPNICEDIIYQCLKCYECFKSQNDLNEHAACELSEHEALIICKICKRKFTLMQSVKRHMKIHNVAIKKDKLCTFCGKSFYRMYDLKRHVRVHTNERPYSCDQCGKQFKQTSELKEHMKTHSPVKHYICSQCGKTFATRNGFYIHMKIHSGQKSHKCTFCGNLYITSGALTSHINHIHVKKKPFRCTYEACRKSFVTKLSLEIHMRSHLGEKSYHCSVCKKDLSTQSSLREHKKIHTGEKLRHCKICDIKLGNSQALKKHICKFIR